MEMEKGYSINDGWLVVEAGTLGETEMIMRLVGGEGEQVEIYQPARRQTVTLSKLPINIWYYLKTLREQTEGEC